MTFEEWLQEPACCNLTPYQAYLRGTKAGQQAERERVMVDGYCPTCRTANCSCPEPDSCSGCADKITELATLKEADNHDSKIIAKEIAGLVVANATLKQELAALTSGREWVIDPEAMAKLFHDKYEELAPVYNYETRKESALPWKDVKPHHQQLMIKTCECVIAWLKGEGDGPK